MRVIPGLKAGASIDEAVRLIAQAFKAAGIEEPQVDARALLGHALRLDRAQLIAQSDRLLEAREIDAVSALAARRLKREPVARILGRKEFWDQMLDVSAAVLVPRPETETVVEAALDAVARDGTKLEKLRILDIGTGTGALLLALLGELPNAAGTGTDISAGGDRGRARQRGTQRPCGALHIRRLRYRARRRRAIRTDRIEPALYPARRDRGAGAGGARLRPAACARRR